MNESKTVFDREIFRRVLETLRVFLTSPVGGKAMAPPTLLEAFSLVITQFQAISAYASVLLRLGEFVDSAEECQANDPADETPSP